MTRVSVVMPVYNERARVRASMDSVLRQDYPPAELIVVDDGSVDETAAEADRCTSSTTRIRLIERPHEGITAALIAGCQLARGELIARQDVGDVSLPGRLRRQVEMLTEAPHAPFAVVGTTVVERAGRPLYRHAPNTRELLAGLLASPPAGPVHGAVMFRRNHYERAGGYRPEFRVAQDLDLWTRMIELGDPIADPALFYQAEYRVNSISATHRRAQSCVAVALRRLQQARVQGDEHDVLETLVAQLAIELDAPRKPEKDRAAANYFIGSCLLRSDPDAARDYLAAAWRAQPWRATALAKWFTSHVLPKGHR